MTEQVANHVKTKIIKKNLHVFMNLQPPSTWQSYENAHKFTFLNYQ